MTDSAARPYIISLEEYLERFAHHRFEVIDGRLDPPPPWLKDGDSTDSIPPPPEFVPEQEYWDHYAEHRFEWCDGKLEPLFRITQERYELVIYLRNLLDAYFSIRKLGRTIGDPFLMQLPSIPSYREPAIQVILRENPGQFTEYAMIGPPDICIEVVSPESVTRDCLIKVSEYEKAGVREYWIIDPSGQGVALYRLTENGIYDLIQPNADGIYETPLLPGFKLDTSILWLDDLPGPFEIADAIRAMLSDQP